MSIADELERLAALRSKGLLTDEEFEREKRKLLDGTGGAETKPRQQHSQPNPQKPESRGMLRGAIGLGALVLLVVILFGTLSRNDNSMSIRSIVRPLPDPVVVDQQGNDGNSSILEYRATVKATIRNKGADGHVRVLARVMQDGKTDERTDRRYMNAEENVNVEFTFDEVNAAGEDFRYSVTVRPD